MTTPQDEPPPGLAFGELTPRMRLALDTARLVVSSLDLETGVIEGVTFRGSPLDTGQAQYRSTYQERLSHIHPDDRDAYEAAMRSAIERGPDDYELELRLAPEQGEDRWYQLNGTIVRDASGRAVRVDNVSFEVTERRRRERALNEAYAQLRQLSRRLDEVREEERRDLARRLHDDLAQGLTALALQLELLIHPAPGEDPGPRARDMQRLLEEQLDVVRQLSAELRPPLLDELGLVPALQSYLATQRARFDRTIVLLANEREPRATAEVESATFRIVQEAVANAIRHARARRIEVAVARRDGGLGVRVSDDGGGFDVDQALRGGMAEGRFGLMRLRGRVNVLEGRVAIDSAPGRGATIDVWLPCPGGA